MINVMYARFLIKICIPTIMPVHNDIIRGEILEAIRSKPGL